MGNQRRRGIREVGARPDGDPNTPATPPLSDPEKSYAAAVALALNGEHPQARAAYVGLRDRILPKHLQALVENDLGVLAAIERDWLGARQMFDAALDRDADCVAAQDNRRLLQTPEEPQTPIISPVATRSNAAVAIAASPDITQPTADVDAALRSFQDNVATQPTRVAILSLLFNWPSTGGGTIHTAELGKFLLRAGYDVRHIYARNLDWGVGKVTEETGVPSIALEFFRSDWNPDEIRRRFRSAVDAFSPDQVIITDSWNTKPLLAEAVHGYRYFLRLAALECLCPLNNVRLLPAPGGGVVACPKHQLATPGDCRRCVQAGEHHSGGLHRADRALAGYGEPSYDDRLRRAFSAAAGVLVVNPLIATMVSPYAQAVHVVPSGFDPERFPWPPPARVDDSGGRRKTTLLFAGLVEEYMKGFRVLHEACWRLHQTRDDFELVATADPPSQVDEFTRFIGWQSQSQLPDQLRQADILVFPTVAEEALGRSAVEAMGAGLPVIASRIGGLTYTVIDGLTGLLFEPGNVDDLVEKIVRLLDDPDLRHRMGAAGRERYEREYTWSVILAKHYRPLFASRPKLPSEPAPRGFQPQFNTTIDRKALIAAVAEFFGLPPRMAHGMWNQFSHFYDSGKYAERLGEFKAFSREETYVIAVLLWVCRPACVVQFGLEDGRSTRRFVDLLQFLGMAERLFAVGDGSALVHVDPSEIELHPFPLPGELSPKILERHASGVLIVDCHDRRLIQETLTIVRGSPADWTLVLHDCGKGLCNPGMLSQPADAPITSETGVWQRHLLAAEFAFDNPLSPELDDRKTPLDRLRVFDTQHGLGVILKRTSWGQPPEPPVISQN